MRLIDADALLKDITLICSSAQFGKATAKLCVKQAPTIEAVTLPCKVGDTVWVNITDWHISLERGINKGIVTRIVLIPDNNVLCVQFHNDYGVMEIPFDFKNIGKTVFLTKQAAEKALDGKDNNCEKEK